MVEQINAYISVVGDQDSHYGRWSYKYGIGARGHRK